MFDFLINTGTNDILSAFLNNNSYALGIIAGAAAAVYRYFVKKTQDPNDDILLVDLQELLNVDEEEEE